MTETSIHETLTDIRKEVRSGFKELRENLREEIGNVRGDIGKLGERTAKVEGWKDDHKAFHLAQGDDTLTFTPQVGAPIADRKCSWIPKPGDLKSYFLVGFLIIMGGMTAWNTYSSPSQEAVEQIAVEQERVADAFEREVVPARKAAVAATKDREEIQELVEALARAAGMDLGHAPLYGAGGDSTEGIEP